MTLLSASGLNKSFGGIHAIKNVSLSVAPGEILGLVGPNGAGKTTLINLITGVYTPDSGSLSFEDQDLLGLSPHQRVRRGISRTFQNVRLIGEMTVWENIALGQHSAADVGLRSLFASRRREPERSLRAAGSTLLEDLELGPWRDQPVQGLPLGIQRRVEIARALATGAKLLLLDEPTSGMIESDSRDVAQRLNGLRQAGHAIILIEHKMNVVLPISDRVVVLNFGEVIADDSPTQIQQHQQVIDAYLGSS